MTIGISPVQAASSKKTNTKRYNFEEQGSFSKLLQQYVAQGAVTPASPRKDGFEERKQDTKKHKKIQGIEVQAMQRQVMKVNREILESLLVQQY